MMLSDSQNLQPLTSTGFMVICFCFVSSTFFLTSKLISNAMECLHVTFLNLESGQEQTNPDSVDMTSYQLSELCDFTL